MDVLEGETAGQLSERLRQDARFVVSISDAATARRRLRTGRTSLVIVGRDTSGLELEYWLDPTRSQSVLARHSADDALQRASGREDVARVRDVEIQEPGARYIDFLIPGILGMNLMGGGLWGVGFVTVDMRIRKLLKRFVATPIKKSHFLIAIMFSRMLFIIPEIFILLVFARYAFGVKNYGSWVALFVVVLLGAVTFSGIGLLVASRAKTLETVSGLMNLVMLPMWLLGGIFFFLRALSRSHTAFYPGFAAHAFERRTASAHARGSPFGVTRDRAHDPDRLRNRNFRPRAPLVPLDLRIQRPLIFFSCSFFFASSRLCAFALRFSVLLSFRGI